ncbi:MAG: ABC-type nitrate/sulfonate/bicarbonate transport system ATPase subunit [Myxococcota bacterium]|jgi:ABC-type nitrate/sulfonate/bicarbonate transport system ATPase subunit
MTNNTLLDIQRLDKSFGEHKILCQLNLQLVAGQRIAILGESGCGKSTLLRIIAGLEQADGGSVQVADQGKCQMVFQDLGLWPSHTAKQQLVMAARASNIADAAQAADKLLEQLNIAQISNRKPSTLSGGEARRLAFARVLICQPQLILLDEAFSSLDNESRQRGLDLLEELLQYTNAAVILVTHNQDDALQLNLPIYDLVAGQLQAR